MTAWFPVRTQEHLTYAYRTAHPVLCCGFLPNWLSGLGTTFATISSWVFLPNKEPGGPQAIITGNLVVGPFSVLFLYAVKHSLTATAIMDLIKDVLKNPLFNSDKVDTDMLQRLSAAIDSGDLRVISMRKEGDGAQNPELFVRPVEKVLSELIGDMRLAGNQHYAFHEYKDPHGNRLFAGDANGCVSF